MTTPKLTKHALSQCLDAAGTLDVGKLLKLLSDGDKSILRDGLKKATKERILTPDEKADLAKMFPALSMFEVIEPEKPKKDNGDDAE